MHFYFKAREIFSKTYDNLSKENFLDWLFGNSDVISDALKIEEIMEITKNDLEVLNSIRKWKRWANEDFSILELSIMKKEGFFFMEYHSFSVEEILQSKHLSGLKSKISKINSDAESWLDNGKFTEVTMLKYNEYQAFLDEKFENLYKSLKERKPSNWDKFIDGLTRLREYIFQKLPKIGIKLGKSDKPKLLGN